MLSKKMARPINLGGGTLGGEEEVGADTFFQESESFIMIIVCLVGSLLSVLDTVSQTL